MSEPQDTHEVTRNELLSVITGLYDYADVEIPAQWPVGSEHVVELLAKCGYRLSNGDLIAWANGGLLIVPMQNGRRLYGPREILNVMQRCEALRRWQPGHVAHQHKFSAIELRQAECEAAGGKSAFSDLDAFDLEGLLLCMEEAETRHCRHALRVAIAAKLQAGASL